MGVYLDLEDLVVNQPLATQELDVLLKATQRYEKLRKFNVQQFKKLFESNLKGQGSFDELLDKFDLKK